MYIKSHGHIDFFVLWSIYNNTVKIAEIFIFFRDRIVEIYIKLDAKLGLYFIVCGLYFQLTKKSCVLPSYIRFVLL